NGEVLQNIFFVYGDLYCDSHEIYENVENVIKDGLASLDEVEFAETKELGRINKVDHLGISDLRVRGMWLIKTPFQHFGYLTDKIVNYTFKLVALIPEDRYKDFENIDEFETFCNGHGVSISNEEIEDPKNPANIINSKLITYYY
ncbi:MAG: NgoPII family restriction endonuclease, partial [Parabacteroides sp.]|nr:NgoPII family restriction endonuclease [Parabacteroides sp.]